MKKLMPLDAIEAYRGFAVEGDKLIAPIQGGEWVPGINASWCATCGPTPQKGCRCGFYSFVTQEIAQKEWGEEAIIIGRTVSGTPLGVDGRRGGDFVLAIVANAGIIWPYTRGYRSQYAEVRALLTTEPDLFSPVLARYDLIAVRPLSKEDRGMCEGMLYGFDSYGPGEVVLQVAGLTMQDATGEYHMDPLADGYRLVAVAGVGTHVGLTFELREGRRWVTDINVQPPG